MSFDIKINNHASCFLRYIAVRALGYSTTAKGIIFDITYVLCYILFMKVHDRFDYQVGDCRVLTNPRGYNGYERTGFDSAFTFEI